MINPTTSAGSQFISPFDILPNVVYTNPTGINSSQFTAPFTSYLLGGFAGPISNPTFTDTSQFSAPFVGGRPVQFQNPTQNNSQFTAPFNILPDIVFPGLANPTQNNSQFTAPFNILPDPIQFKSPYDKKPIQDKGLENADKLDTIPENFAARNWTAQKAPYTNISLKTTLNNVFGFASIAGASFLGFPQIGQVGEALLEDKSLSGTYTTLPFDKLTTKLFPGTDISTPVLYPDFRSRLNIDKDADVGAGKAALAYLTSRRIDGASAVMRGSIKAGIYAAAAATPVGPYSVFNLSGGGKTGYGWGEHDNQYAIRKDFTMRSHIAKRWVFGVPIDLPGGVGSKIKGHYANTVMPTEIATPFRGDKVSVIDFGQRKLADAYLWKPSFFKNKFLGIDLNKLGLTQDFIKFFFTGPKLQAGNDIDEDDIIVFRAALTNLSDSFSPSWTSVNMIGRADPNYIYSGYSRDLSIGFDIYATDRDEMQPIYRKLNALAGFTAPTYDPESIAMEGPWMRITIGDLFNQTPVILNSLSYDYGVTDAPWEINIENDPNMMQVPFKISVTMAFNVISDYLPQKGGRFYTLAKKFADGVALAGNDNWLSDTKGNIDAKELRRRFKTFKNKVVSNTGNTNQPAVPPIALDQNQQDALKALSKFN